MCLMDCTSDDHVDEDSLIPRLSNDVRNLDLEALPWDTRDTGVEIQGGRWLKLPPQFQT